jgi:hypothetical protein
MHVNFLAYAKINSLQGRWYYFDIIHEASSTCNMSQTNDTEVCFLLHGRKFSVESAEFNVMIRRMICLQSVWLF